MSEPEQTETVRLTGGGKHTRYEEDEDERVTYETGDTLEVSAQETERFGDKFTRVSEEPDQPDTAGPARITEGFPGGEHLLEAGISTVEQLRGYLLAGDLTDITGIGPATAEDIRDAVQEESE